MISTAFQKSRVCFLIAKIVLILSGTYLSFVFNTQSAVFFIQAFKQNKNLAFLCICVLAAIVFAGLFILLFRFKLLENLYERLRKMSYLAQALLLLFSALCAGTYISQFYNSANVNIEYLNNINEWWFHLPYAFEFAAQPAGFAPPGWILTLLLFIPLTVFFLYFITALTGVVQSVMTTLSKAEKRFLVIASAAAIIYIVFLYNSTDIYYGGMDRIYSYDSLSDSSYLLNPFYYWSYYQYPLEPNFSLPFVVLAKQLSPYIPLWESVFRTLIQFEMLLLVIVMLSRMISDNPATRLLTLLIFSFSFQTLILATIYERRVMTLIFLIIAIFQSVYQKKDDKFWISVASGAIICNAYVSLMSIRSKKTFIKDLLLCGAVFVFIAAFLGKISGLLDLRTQVDNFENRGWLDADLGIRSKLLHYLNFVSSCLISPLSQAANGKAWEMVSPEFNFFSILGAVIASLAVAGFLLNFKNKFAQISFVSILVSVYFLFVKSLNANENAIVLNTLFFAWAFISLTIMAIDGLFDNQKVKTAILSVIAGGCLIYNAIAVIQLYNFGVIAYPIR